MRSLSVALALLVSCATPEAPEAPADSAAPSVERPSVPVQGGTLARTDGGTIVFADPGMDTIDVVLADPLTHVGNLQLEVGAQPSRVATQGNTAYVVLRGSGSVAAVELASVTETWREWVCPEPRGVAVDPSTSQIAVACASGELVTLAPEGGVLRSVFVDADLRDVVFDGDDLWVSRFRSAEVLRLDRSGAIVQRQVPPEHELLVHAYVRSETFLPHVGWRMVAHPEGGVALLHQRSTDHHLEDRPGTRQSDLREPEFYTVTTTTTLDVESPPPYYGPPDKPEPIVVEITEQHAVEYNGPDCRSPVVHSAITRFQADKAPQTSVPILAGALAVDLSITGRDYVLATAGSHGSEGQQLTVTDERALFDSDFACLEDGLAVDGGVGQGNATSVAGLGSELVIASRYPREVRTMDGALRLDKTFAPAGFAVFHEDTGIGMACASCHPEALDDGHTWRSEAEGTRRTMRAGGGLAKTAPYHWDGRHRNLDELMADTFVQRMDGYVPVEPDVQALLAFLDDVKPPALSARDNALVEQGRALFVERTCATCHSGEQLTNDRNEDIGKSETVQTPSLVGVGLRTPLMRDGCAQTLEDRFTNVYCGGEKHGAVDPDETEVIAALVAYLETL